MIGFNQELTTFSRFDAKRYDSLNSNMPSLSLASGDHEVSQMDINGLFVVVLLGLIMLTTTDICLSLMEDTMELRVSHHQIDLFFTFFFWRLAYK